MAIFAPNETSKIFHNPIGNQLMTFFIGMVYLRHIISQLAAVRMNFLKRCIAVHQPNLELSRQLLNLVAKQLKISFCIS